MPGEPDVLVMTATPIPRTLALTLYGDLDLSVLDELPPGRTPIVTRCGSDDESPKVWEFVRKQVAAGHQAYVVYPVIAEKTNAENEESELKAAIKMYRELSGKIFADLKVGLLHGRLDAELKDQVMRMFQRGELQILVATTVIEVGVDVPNATVMVIEHAERFGLAQLHQLRGRIGRGAAKSYCILMTGGKVSEEGQRRLDAMVKTNDGFKIAELDLELRGPGEFFGTRQAGMPSFRVANIIRDAQLLEAAKHEAAAVIAGPNEEISGRRNQPRAGAHAGAVAAYVWVGRGGVIRAGVVHFWLAEKAYEQSPSRGVQFRRGFYEIDLEPDGSPCHSVPFSSRSRSSTARDASSAIHCNTSGDRSTKSCLGPRMPERSECALSSWLLEDFCPGLGRDVPTDFGRRFDDDQRTAGARRSGRHSVSPGRPRRRHGSRK